MRSAYAEAQTLALTASADGETAGNATYAAGSEDGDFTITVENVIIKTNKANAWSDQATDLAFTAPTDPGTSDTKSLVFTYDDGELKTVAFGS